MNWQPRKEDLNQSSNRNGETKFLMDRLKSGTPLRMTGRPVRIVNEIQVD